MGRPLYPYELTDADFSWLMHTFQEHNPKYTVVEVSCLPIVLLPNSFDSNSTQPPVAADDAKFDIFEK